MNLETVAIIAVLLLIAFAAMRKLSAEGDKNPYLMGRDLGTLDISLEDQVRALLEQKQKINAIKFYRKQTGLGLKESKDAVEAIEWQMTPAEPLEMPGDLRDEVRREIAQGRKINAIKAYRDQTGVGLREAKDAVEEIERQMRIK